MARQTQGYRMLRFWNNEVMENIDGVCAAITAAGAAAGVIALH